MAEVKIIARPWQPQDLIDDLQEIIDEESDSYLNTRRTTLCTALDFLKEHFAEQKWISVKDRLPFPGTKVLVYKKAVGDNYAKIAIDYTFIDEGTQYWSGDIISWKTVITHWMPLPEPPKGE